MYEITIETNPIQVAVIEDSVSPLGVRLLTLHLRYPRFIHAELMTHRVFSRNARSSRAVPVEKLLREPVYMPHFMKNQKGMQAFEDLDSMAQGIAESNWLLLVKKTREHVQALMDVGVHKQWANRPLEWFGFIDVLVSSTDWFNWFALRDHEDAMPEIRELARRIREAYDISTPRIIPSASEADAIFWHLPYINEVERHKLPIDMLCRVSAARCARISYKPFDSDSVDLLKDLELANKLLASEPLHASPAEHQACPDWRITHEIGKGQTALLWQHPEEHGNFFGWRQFRKTLPNENSKDAHYK